MSNANRERNSMEMGPIILHQKITGGKLRFYAMGPWSPCKCVIVPLKSTLYIIIRERLCAVNYLQ